MKNQTLADACVALANTKIRRPEICDFLRPIEDARKIVLDDDMSRYVWDLAGVFWRGGLRNRIRMIESARLMARLPHPQTFIELNYHSYLNHATKHECDSSKFPTRIGWFLRQHPKIEFAFIATEISSHMEKSNHVVPRSLSTIWCADNSPLPWQSVKLWKDEQETDLHIVMMPGYHSTQAAWTYTFGKWDRKFVDDPQQEGSKIAKPLIPVRALWALLATINDLPILPILSEDIEPKKKLLFGPRKGKKPLTHTILHLDVPQAHWYKITRRTETSLRRRAYQLRGHEVRGHWRKDTYSPLNEKCPHDFNANMYCRFCGGHKIWVPEHQRGDASLGFVTHDYELHRKAG